ncbi:SRPBCC family protein [Alteribacter populi]|uniref:SRPBCC family protein n=1 Tax=Alteribacter populi TaxID=2011011 RepID=UPI000BBAC85E|nr:hypothetical protein [Alteribacter populi]
MFKSTFRYETTIDQPLDEVWGFFQCNKNLAKLTGFPKVDVSGPPIVKEGAVIHLRLHFRVLALRWRARIIRVEDKHLFQDVGEKVPFPFRLWTHTHRFEAVSDKKTKMIDEVVFSSWIPTPFVYIILFGMFCDRKRQIRKHGSLK